jgi:hypothetical protein
MLDIVIFILVLFHLCTEYGHYFYDFFIHRKESRNLEALFKHHNSCTNDKKLNKLQRDVNKIKKALGIK